MKRYQKLMAASFCGLAMPALASDVMVGTGFGEVYRAGASGSTLFIPNTLCSMIDSMASNGRTLYMGDQVGSIIGVRTSHGLSPTFFWQPEDVNSLAVHNGDLITGSRSGVIRRINGQTGEVVNSWQVNSTLEALLVVGDTVYAAGHNTFIYRGNANTGNFVMWSACLGQVNSMTINGQVLLVGGSEGRVYRFNAANGAFQGYFENTGDNVGIAMVGENLLTVSSAGALRYVNPATGALVAGGPMVANGSAVAVLPPCVADYNNDTVINIDDFVAYGASFAAGEPRADLNGTGTLNIDDFVAFQQLYAAGCP